MANAVVASKLELPVASVMDVVEVQTSFDPEDAVEAFEQALVPADVEVAFDRKSEEAFDHVAFVLDVIVVALTSEVSILEEHSCSAVDSYSDDEEAFLAVVAAVALVEALAAFEVVARVEIPVK